jgi:hypothetical protein
MAGIDYSIPLGIKPVQVESPTNTLGRMYQLQEQQAAAQARQMQLAEAQQEQRDRTVLGQAFSTPKLTRESAIEAVQKMGAAHLVPVIHKQFDDWDDKRLKRGEALSKARAADAEYMGGLFAGVAQQGYDPMAALAAIDHAEDTFGEEFAPRAAEIRAQISAAGNDTAAVRGIVEGIRAQSPDYHQRQASQATATRAETDAADAAAQRPGRVAEARQKERAEIATRLAAAPNQEGYDLLRNALPPGTKMLFPERFNRDRVLSVGLSAQEAVTDTDRDAARNETRRHNIQTETQAKNSLAETIAEHKRVQDRAGGEGATALTPNRQSVIEQWRADQLLNLEELYQEESVTNDQYNKRKMMIENAYRAQVSPGQRAPVPAAVPAPVAAPPAPLFRPNTLGAAMDPQFGAPPPVAPPPPARAAAPPPIPQDVAEFFAGKGPGRIVDPETNQVYRKLPDGRIVREQ